MGAGALRGLASTTTFTPVRVSSRVVSMSSSEAPTMARISRKRSGYMHTHRWTTFGVAAALIALGAAACTDPTVSPTSTVTGANFYNDLASYQAFLAKVYAGLAVGGQNGGDGSTDIQGIDGGFSQYMRLYWELEELPTDEAVIAWGDQTLPELSTQGWNPSNTFVNAMYYRVYFQIGMANELLRQTTDAVLAGRGVTAQLKTTIHTYRAEARFLRALSYWHGLDFFGDIPLLTENDPLGTIPKQSTRAVVFNYVVSELTAIRDSLQSEEHTSELQSPCNLVCRLLLEKKKQQNDTAHTVRLH